MSWEYSEKTTQLFMDAVHGKPGTHLGEIEDPDAVGEHGSIACGDAMRFMFRVDKHPADPLQDVIVEARYMTFGCTSAIAASEALCRLIEEGGYTPPESLKITSKDIVDYLGGLPDQKIHCSVMGAEALEAAVQDWAKRRGVDLKDLGVETTAEDDDDEGRIVCSCFSVTEPFLRRKIEELNLRTIEDITNATKAGGSCTACHHAPGGLQDLLDEIWGGTPVPEPSLAGSGGGDAPSGSGASPAATASRMSTYQLIKQIERTVEERIAPALQADGGDIEIVDIKDTLVYCRLSGACSGCVNAGQTLKLTVERTLREQVDERIRVISV